MYGFFNRGKKVSLSSLILSCLIFLSFFCFSLSVSHAKGGNSEQGIWIYTYSCNEATNKSIDLFFGLFNINFTRTNSVSKLGSVILIVLGANMTSVPNGLEDKIRKADFSVVLAHGFQDTDYSIPQNLAKLYGFQYRTDTSFRECYGNVYSDQFLYDIYYRWNDSATSIRWLDVDSDVAETMFWVSRWGYIQKRAPAVVRLKDHTRIFIQVPIFVRGSQMAGLDRWFSPNELREQKNHFINIYEIPLLYWALQHSIALPSLAKDGADSAFVLRIDDVGVGPNALDNIRELEEFVNAGVPLTLFHIAKYDSEDILNELEILESMGCEIASHGYSHSEQPLVTVNNGSLHDLFDQGYNRKIYTKNIDDDPSDYEMWIDLDEDTKVDEDEWTHAGESLFVPKIGGGVYIYVEATTSDNVTIKYGPRDGAFEFWSNLTVQEQILDDCLSVYNYTGFSGGGLRTTNDTYQALINKGFAYIGGWWMGPYPIPVSYDRNGRAYNITWVPSSSLGYAQWKGGTWLVMSSESDYQNNFALISLCGGLMVNLAHIGGWTNSEANLNAIGNFTQKNSVWRTTYTELLNYFKAMRKVKIRTMKGMIELDYSRTTEEERTLLDGLTLRYKNEKIVVPADTDPVVVIDMADPMADAGSNQTVDEDTLVTFDGSASSDNVGIANYSWAFMDMTLQILSGVSPVYVFATPGVYNVTLNVTDAAGNWDTDTVTITVLDVTKPVAHAGSGQTVSLGETITFDAGNSSDNMGIVSYLWDFGDGTTGIGITVDHTYTNPGTYTVTLTVKDSAGNTDIISTTVKVLPIEAFPLPIAGVAILVIAIAVAIAILWRRRK